MNALIKKYQVKTADGNIKKVTVKEFYSETSKGIWKKDGFTIIDVQIIC